MTYENVFKAATGGEPYPYQVRLATDPELPLALEVPTGAGKTAAAVMAWMWRRRFAEESVRRTTPRRLVFCLPMRTLVEQTVDQAQQWVDRLGLGAEIGVHKLLGGEVDERWYLHPERDAIVVGTQDMLMSRALMRGYATTRGRWPIEFALLNNDVLWVIDEIQLAGPSMPTSRQLQAFRDQMGTCGRARTMWMSATLDTAWFDTVDAGPLADDAVLRLTSDDLKSESLAKRMQAVKHLERVELPPAAKREQAVAAAVLDAHVPGTVTIVVLNTVDAAQKVHTDLKKRGAGNDAAPRLVLLHSRFRPPDRTERYAELLDAEKAPGEAGVIIVSTQVVEAGVDISSRTLVTELAPWASIVQRIGRANRRGEHPNGATIRWIDVDAAKNAAPYEPEQLDRARDQLLALEGTSLAPADVPRVDEPLPVTAWLRRSDLRDLFDTSPDLAGRDVDVARFIRDGEELTVGLAWRELAAAGPDEQERLPARDELCPAPIGEVRKAFKRGSGEAAFAWTYDHVEGRWRPAGPADVRPGGMYLVAPQFGRYTAERGFDPAAKAPVPPLDTTSPVDALRPAEDAGSLDPDSFQRSAQTIAQHTDDVCDALEVLLGGLDGLVHEARSVEAIRTAARWHDAGKAHAVFQATMRGIDLEEAEADALPPTALLAKSDDDAARGRHQRPGFRHELASVLAYLAAEDLTGTDDETVRALTAYLIAAHHGKMRVAARPNPAERPPRDGRRSLLGVHDGDALPATTLGGGVETTPVALDLALLDASFDGDDATPEWYERVELLRDDPTYGPFRLAWHELLVRVADMRASADPVRVSAKESTTHA